MTIAASTTRWRRWVRASRLLRPVLSEFAVESPPVWILYPQNRNLTPRVRAFVDFMSEWSAQSGLSAVRM